MGSATAPAPPQNYSVVVALLGPSKNCYTFSRSKNDVPTGGAQDKWNIDETSADIQKNWADVRGATVHISCTNSMDLGAFVDEIVHEIETLVGYVQDWVI